MCDMEGVICGITLVKDTNGQNFSHLDSLATLSPNTGEVM